MMLIEDLSEIVASELNVPSSRIMQLLESDIKISTIHRTTRFFGEQIALKYYSLCLSSVSVESLIWVLKSIRNDKMQPTEGLIFSRFREYFAVKILTKDWKRILESLQKNKEFFENFNRYKEILGEIYLKEIDENTQLFLMRGVGWVYEDISEVNDSDTDYQSFLRYIDNYFNDSQTELVNSKQTDKIKWLSSVENTVKMPALSDSSQAGSKKSQRNELMNKAIPGGKYGCTLLVKNFGSSDLRYLSAGRIYALIKNALNNQIINHIKTHIVRNEQKLNNKNQKLEQQILELQTNILDLLKENEKEGVTLAQLKLSFETRYNRSYNIQDLGFPKLKNFLQTIEDKIEYGKAPNGIVKISIKKKSSCDARLVKPLPIDLKLDQHDDANKQLKQQKDDANKQYKQDLINCFFNPVKTKGQNNFQSKIFGSERNDKTIRNQTVTDYGFVPKRIMSPAQIQDYVSSVKQFIMKKLQNTRFGIEMTKLEEELSDHTGHPFEPHLFNVHNFHQFLILNFVDDLEIDLKKNVKSKLKTGPSKQDYLIFLKTGFQTAKMGSDQESSFGSFNQLIGSNKNNHQESGQGNLLSEPSQSITKSLLCPIGNSCGKSNTRHSDFLHKNQTSAKSTFTDDDDIELYKSFGYDQSTYPFHSHGNSRIEYGEDNTEVTNEPDANDQIDISTKKFVNYVYDDE